MSNSLRYLIIVCMFPAGLLTSKVFAAEDPLVKGRLLLNKSIEAMGTSAVFGSVRSIRQSAVLSIITTQGTNAIQAETLISYPSTAYLSLKTARGEIRQLLKDGQAWMITPTGNQLASPQVKTSLAQSLWQNLIYLYSHANDESIVVEYLGQEELNNEVMDVLLITPPDLTGFKLFLNNATMVPVSMRLNVSSPQGSLTMDSHFMNYQTVNGMLVPYRIAISQNGRLYSTVDIETLEINPDIPESTFLLPQ